ncbi:MAG: FecR family protein [Bacteroidales bacterium]
MRKYTLIKFFNGEASEAEVDEIISWINSSPENRRYFAEQKQLNIALQITDIKVDSVGVGNNSDLCSKQRKRPIYLQSFASRAFAIAASFAVFFAIGFLVNEAISDKDVGNQIQVIADGGVVMNELYTEKGVKGFLILPDSTKVWLNSDSRITYPQIFSDKTRDVKISGEAYFEVVKDSLHPMIVKTDRNFSIEVLGTSFNIKSYNNDDKVEATLYSGVIKAHYKNNTNSKIETVILKPNQSFTYADSASTAVSDNSIFNYNKPERQKAWKDGALIFDNTSMREVIKMMERWHGAKFIVLNNNIFNYKLTAEFSSESVVQTLEIMKLIMPIDYSFSNNTITLK